MKKLCMLFVTLLLLLAVSAPVAAYDYANPIRVRLAANSSPTLSVTSGSYTVANNGGNLFTLKQGESLAVKYNGSNYSFTHSGQDYGGGGNLYIRSGDGQGRIKYQDAEYRGDFSLIYSDGSVYIINTLGTEEYLYSVVMKEIGGYYPSLEALKAQAICSRCLAVYWLKPNTYYDVVPTTTNQVYAGYSGEATGSYGELVRRAVDETKYQILFYRKDDASKVKVEAYYSANNGGRSEDVTNVWGSDPNRYPYLRAVDSDWDSLPFLGENGSLKFPSSYHWTAIYNADGLRQTLLEKKGVDIGTLRNVNINRANTDRSDQPTASGRVYSITYGGDKSSVTLDRNEARTTLGLRSTRYDVIYSESLTATAPLTTLTFLNGDPFASTIHKTGHYLIFEGLGYGHGVGMSQWSACVMAYKGYSHWDILNHFFNPTNQEDRLSLEEYRY